MTLVADIKWQIGNKTAHAFFTANKGITALLGKSGAGKTSLARAICGLLPSDGKLSLDGQNISAFKTQDRNIGFVMQNPALFPTMTVEKNIKLAAKIPETEIEALVKLADITHLLKHYPHTLSGGETKRVTLIRSIAAKPDFLILDEPLTGLDTARKQSLLTLIQTLNTKQHIPMLFITHQLDEILTLADYAVLMDDGQTVAEGSVPEILNNTKTTELLGLNSIVSIISATASLQEQGLQAAKIGAQTLWVQNNDKPVGAALKLRLLARDIAIATTPITNTSIQNILEANILDWATYDETINITCQPIGADDMIISQISKRAFQALKLEQGQKIYLLIKAVAVKNL